LFLSGKYSEAGGRDKRHGSTFDNFVKPKGMAGYFISDYSGRALTAAPPNLRF